jgi:hypothetical protein
MHGPLLPTFPDENPVFGGHEESPVDVEPYEYRAIRKLNVEDGFPDEGCADLGLVHSSYTTRVQVYPRPLTPQSHADMQPPTAIEIAIAA